jgi:hypothetical protein
MVLLTLQQQLPVLHALPYPTVSEITMKNSAIKGPLGLLLFLAFICLSGIAFIQPTTAALIPRNSEDASHAPRSLEERAVAPGRWVYVGVDVGFVSQALSDNNARLTQIRVQDPSIPTFDVTMVSNTGDFASAWWWYFGIEADTVSGLVAGKRLISIDPYQTSAGLRFAVVMVPNDGVHAKSWWWYVGVDENFITSQLDQNNARLISLRPYLDGGQRLFGVIMIANTGADAARWEWWFGKSIAELSDRVTNGNLRVTALAPDPLGGWDAIMVEATGVGWWWWFGVSPADIVDKLTTHNTRLIDISTDGGGFDIVELDNNEGPQVSEI